MNSQRHLTELFLNDCRQLIQQSLIKLGNCLSQLEESQVWERANPQCNSIGNLILHICGNLRQWTSAGLGCEADTRDRNNEFSTDHHLGKGELLQHLDQHLDTLDTFLGKVDASALCNLYEIQGFKVNGLQAINHTITHFVGHTHQIIYMTRVMLGDAYQFAWSPEQGREDLPI